MTEMDVKQNRLGPSKVEKRTPRQDIILKMLKEHNMKLSIENNSRKYIVLK